MNCHICGAAFGHTPSCEPLKAVRMLNRTLYALEQAIAQCEAHNNDYHHNTSPQIIAEWKLIAATAKEDL